MPEARLRPPVPTLILPPSDESATFQHVPSGPLRREWEPGCQPDEVYDRLLPGWRAGLRRYLVNRLRGEKEWMAEMQVKVRTPRRDTYFYWTAIFGTHTFFVALLPIFFFFHSPVRGRSLLYIVSLGVYVSSFAKDLVCTPRPYSPPVIRLSMSTHHNEYGFPSSHSTNSVSIALFFGQLLWDIQDQIGFTAMCIGWAVNLVYVVSVVGGRIYTGMHSTADIIGGSLMGFGCWAFWLVVQNWYEAWADSASDWVPMLSIPITIALVHFHPEPVDDCPCFEDAIAVLSCTMGSFVGHWQIAKAGMTHLMSDHGSIMSGGILSGIIIAVYRVVCGLGIMIIWRMFAKRTLLRVLPPIFRQADKLFDLELTTRRFYKAATDYDKIPQPKIRSVPSVLDLHPDDSPSPSNGGSPSSGRSPAGSIASSPILIASSASTHLPLDAKSQEGIRQRNLPRTPDTTAIETYGGEQYVWVSRRQRKSRADRAKYDAEVLTKVGVYAGLGYLATTPIPIMFGMFEDWIKG